MKVEVRLGKEMGMEGGEKKMAEANILQVHGICI